VVFTFIKRIPEKRKNTGLIFFSVLSMCKVSFKSVSDSWVVLLVSVT